MNITFRTDSSTQIGTGHVMRCLTLANALKEQGADCQFICREHEGHLIHDIEKQGFVVHRLAVMPHEKTLASALAHAAWLGATQEQDLEACTNILKTAQSDWLIVDHYALDTTWESSLRPYTHKIMVIDDLADRVHDCDLLLDQNLGRKKEDYAARVGKNTQVLVGPQYALLRPEFAQWREYSLKRRSNPKLEQILISLGGVDKDNKTSKVLEALSQCTLPADCRIKVVMGATAPWLEQVKQTAALMTRSTDVLVNINNMAELMASSDLAIGAAGSTSWERCCLGLPSLIMVLADNQKSGAQALAQSGGAIKINQAKELSIAIKSLATQPAKQKTMSKSASQLVDGLGAKVLVSYLIKNQTKCRFRRMEIADLEMVRSWRNSPEVRSYMFHQNEISIQEHKRWFENKQQDKNHELLIFECAHEPQGFLNLKINANSVIEWGFYLAPEAQGQLGKLFGEEAIKYCFYQLKASRINGEVLSHNIRSQKFHERLGFKLNQSSEVTPNQENQSVYCYSLLSEDFFRSENEKNSDRK